jgi:hypothetical protein
MRSTLAICAGLATLAGCYADAYVEPTPVYATTTTEVPYDAPAPVTITIAPPPPRYEPVLTCGYGTTWVPGRWDWVGSWTWGRGYCAQARPGYAYVPPRFEGGVYYRGHFAPASGGGYVPPPPGGYHGGGTYVPPPSGNYPPGGYHGGGTYVPPPPAGPTYRPAPSPRPPGTYVPPPPAAQPTRRVYQPSDTYIPPPPPR